AGFTQSYTYFTWRNTKAELTEYLTELTQSEMKEYFRANFFTNTPDILPDYLQNSGRPGFLIRAFLAATLSPVYGIYSGFELCEAAPVPGKEEYIDSEKYQFKGRDWNAPGNIKEFLTRLNAIRRGNRALQEYHNLRFHPAENDRILFFSKSTAAHDNRLLMAVTVDPFSPQTAFVRVPLADFGIAADETFQVEDLLTGERFFWTGERNFISLNPHSRPAHIFRVRSRAGRENGQDVYL
ncbi:MAG TPA: alpha-1,4-glucan--maltose-1-phosphate maltosyltransferase, partial [Terrimicrobiaceae bacterium]|nr:alpha-1,4-glucan--maltose-1-phosphate maltosyltransferase [Terrimicrobiaceae bacterium]